VVFCPFCGRAVGRASCSRCGDDLAPAWRFCPRCGAAR
jgi:predicted amidophosphoribosyltransferase